MHERLSYFVKRDSALHRMNPLTKAVLALSIILVAFLSPWYWTSHILFILAIIPLSFAGKVAKEFFTTALRLIIPASGFIFIRQALFQPIGEIVVFQIWVLDVTQESLAFGFQNATRIGLMVSAFTLFLDPNIRNPAWKYQQDICVSFTGVFHETIRVKTKTVTDIDWNLVAHGTGYVHPGLSGEYAMAAAAMAGSNPVRLYWAKRPAGLDVLDSGPLQVEEGVQDDVADALEIPASDSPLELFSMPVAYEKLDYAMYHLKIQGNSILLFRFTLRDGNYCFTDLQNGTEICCPGGTYCP